MVWTAIALAISGVAAGILLQLKIFLPIVGLLLVGSGAFSLANGFSFLDAALTIIVTQTILQSGYFLGVVIRIIVVNGKRPIL